MLVRSGRGLAVSGSLLAGSLAVGLLYVLPATRPGVQAVDDAVWRFAGAIRNAPTTAVAGALSRLGSAAGERPPRGAAPNLVGLRRHLVRPGAVGRRRV